MVDTVSEADSAGPIGLLRDKRMRRHLLISASVLVAALATFLPLWSLTSSNFDEVEHRDAVRQAAGLQAALNAQAQRLIDFGITNSVWTGAVDVIRTGDSDMALTNFPPHLIGGAYHFAGLIAVNRAGRIRGGGLVVGGVYQRLPGQFPEAPILQLMWQPDAAAGTPACGLVTVAREPHLYCGFPAYHTHGKGNSNGGLIMLKPVDAALLATLSEAADAQVYLSTDPGRAQVTHGELPTLLGPMTVNTDLSGHAMTAHAVVTGVDGQIVRLHAVRDRPMREMASTTLSMMLLAAAGFTIVIVVLMIVLVRSSVQVQIGPLRHTTERIMNSGDLSLRVPALGRGHIAGLGRTINAMLGALQQQEQQIVQAHKREEQQLNNRRLEGLGQLAGGVAHDFNNILAVISNYAEMISETLDSPVPDPQDLADARKDIGQISRAAERAARLTKQLLAFGRRDITQVEVLDLNHVIGDIEPMLHRTIGEHIHLVTSLDPQLWHTQADVGQLEQILLNLVANARDAMPGGGTLSIETSNAELGEYDVRDGSPLQAGRYVRVRVSDTGSGMPPEVIERAFEPFYTTKPKGSGTGLGLATVHGIVAAAGGDVNLSSDSGIGTTVTVTLPAVDTPADTLTPDTGKPVEPVTGRPPHETILMVEDEGDLRVITGRILTRAGYHVLTARGGEQALHLAQTHPGPIDLLLTDVIMPEMTGNQVAARVEALRPGIPVLYMSGYAEPVLAENGTLPEGVTIIEKPFTSKELLDHISTRLHRADRLPGPANGSFVNQ
ncbi:putative multi-sensor signal transduction histidine kinase [Actinoplanes missouriensis 431]|uniref:histidine kinase n=1 Tax=Actinoplanes missouriensis (strain ATCC 14538 / DSM 43046 / CBS 188.64 / JCM 3121 / NBRC 102363 / NCIMB 12654 / NRRL B-3342 / UNCC 431) TaxID=512565 RepID=I0H3Y6_ACTM4|nr:putative multi-sensor signal transduction histidine kinase [Actinoplanes missouriensis 431]